VPETDDTSSILPVHIEETIQSIAGLNAEHHANGTRTNSSAFSAGSATTSVKR
jgi:hypothetical protein